MSDNAKLKAKMTPPNPNKTKTIKKTLLIDEALVQKLDSYAYENRKTIKDVAEEALTQFFSKKK